MAETAGLVASIYYRMRNKSGGPVWPDDNKTERSRVSRSGALRDRVGSTWDPSREKLACNEKPLFP